MEQWITKNNCKISKIPSVRCNVYLIQKENQSILVDTGKKLSFNKLERGINKLGEEISSISYLILTHTHYDHCQSARRIKEKSNCKIIVSQNAADSIKNGYTMLPNGTFLFTKIIVKLGRLIGKRKFGYEIFNPDILVKDGYSLNFNETNLRIIETSGHSIDSISILIDDEIAIVGDEMIGIFKKSIFPPFADDISKMFESWVKLFKTGCLNYLPGHGNEIKRNRLKREISIRKLIKED